MGEKSDSPGLSFVGVCVYRHTQASADGEGVLQGGVRGFAPAPSRSAHWLSGLSESDNTLMTGHHLPQQQQGEATYPPKAPPPLSVAPSPILSFSSFFFSFSASHTLVLGFSEIM